MLQQGGHEVHIFEREESLGMDAFAVEVGGMRMDVSDVLAVPILPTSLL
jgi:hypothetical protein